MNKKTRYIILREYRTQTLTWLRHRAAANDFANQVLTERLHSKWAQIWAGASSADIRAMIDNYKGGRTEWIREAKRVKPSPPSSSDQD